MSASRRLEAIQCADGRYLAAWHEPGRGPDSLLLLCGADDKPLRFPTAHEAIKAVRAHVGPPAPSVTFTFETLSRHGKATRRLEIAAERDRLFPPAKAELPFKVERKKRWWWQRP